MPDASAVMLRPQPYALAPAPEPIEVVIPHHHTPAPAPAAAAPVARAGWLDAFRGFTMLCLVSRGLGVPRLQDFDFSVHIPKFWAAGEYLSVDWRADVVPQFEHADWRGMTAWDLIQPFFMFIVGAAMPYAFAKRLAGGKGWWSGLPHVLKRCALLLFCSHLMTANDLRRWDWDFITVLSQIAFTYLVAYLVLPFNWKAQAATALGLLGVHWGLHVYAGQILASYDPHFAAVGPWGPWATKYNFGEQLDRWLIGRNWSGHYATLNCVSSASATIAGVMAANLLRSPASFWRKALVLLGVGAVLIAAGYALDHTLVVPMIKRIWTASFALVSIGITLVALLLFFAVGTAWPRVPWGVFVVFGANCIFLYMASRMFGSHLRKIADAVLKDGTAWFTLKLNGEWFPSLLTQLGGDGRDWAVDNPSLQHPDRWVAFTVDWAVLLTLVYVSYFLYRRKIFFKL